MAVYSLANTNNELYISFEEAVQYLIETYDLSEDDASYVVEDYMYEASAKDAWKASDVGERIHTQKRGMRISGKELNRPGRTDLDKSDRRFEMDSEEYTRNDNLDTSKVNNVKDKTKKQYIRDATRSKAGIVPEYGANPKYSRDADPKAVKAYHRATDKNPYKKYDIDETIKGMSPAKARMVKERMAAGKKLPKSIEDRLIKKREGVAPGDQGKADLGARTMHDYKLYDNAEDEKKQRERLKKMRHTTDPAEYHMNRKAFLKDMGHKDYKGSIMYPTAVHDTKTGKTGYAFRKQPRRQEERSDVEKREDYFHTSSHEGIKNLDTTPRAGEGIFYPRSRLYMAKKNPTYRNGIEASEEDALNGEINRYKIDNINKDAKIYKDDISTYADKASYIETSRRLPVKDIDAEAKEKKRKKEEEEKKKAEALKKKSENSNNK